MSLRHAILGILEYEPMHGYQIRQVLGEGMSAFWPVNLAAIYPALRKLEDDGLLSHRVESGGEGRPDRKVFEITDAGRDELAAWRPLPPEPSDQSTRNPLFLKMFLAKPEDFPATIGWIDAEIGRFQERAAQLRAEIADPLAFSTFFVRFMRETGLAHIELHVQLLQDLRRRVLQKIEGGRPENDSESPDIQVSENARQGQSS